MEAFESIKNGILMIGKKYHTWYNDYYLGTATFMFVYNGCYSFGFFNEPEGKFVEANKWKIVLPVFPGESKVLIIGKQYHLWFHRKYLGRGFFIYHYDFGLCFEQEGHFPDVDKWVLVLPLN